MSIERKISSIDIRISLLKSRGETMNANIIKKLQRQKRMLIKQVSSS